MVPSGWRTTNISVSRNRWRRINSTVWPLRDERDNESWSGHPGIAQYAAVLPGVGKTHITNQPGDRRHRVRTAGNLARRLKVLMHPARLVVDGIGYLRVSQGGMVAKSAQFSIAIDNRT